LNLVLPTVAGVSLTAAFGPSVASASTCPPVRVGQTPSGLPEDWRRALDALAVATSEPGQPWSCAGGELTLALDDSGTGATLKLVDAHGRRVERYVPVADELVPTAQAVLAGFQAPAETKTLPALPTRTERARDAMPPADTVPPLANGEPAREPRVTIAPVVGTRYGTPGGTLWGSAGSRMDLPFGAWSLGIWGRYAEPLVKGDTGQGAQPISEVNLGVSGGRRLIEVPFELRATLDPSVNVVSKQIPRPTPPAARTQDARVAAVDLRVGLGLRAAFRFTGTWRGAMGIEGDWGPEAAGVGAYLGIEAVIR
jgi:hypothetical protein